MKNIHVRHKSRAFKVIKKVSAHTRGASLCTRHFHFWKSSNTAGTQEKRRKKKFECVKFFFASKRYVGVGIKKGPRRGHQFLVNLWPLQCCMHARTRKNKHNLFERNFSFPLNCKVGRTLPQIACGKVLAALQISFALGFSPR